MAKINASEIAATVRTLKRRGEYDHYLSAAADQAADTIGLLLLQALPLRDCDMEAISAQTVPDAELDEEQTRLLVRRVLQRVKGDEEDGAAGVMAVPQPRPRL